jgi:valyl-tRNA synthetase
MTEKRQISQGYIIRILQHFATKLWNITNFVMLFQAVNQNFSYKGKGPLAEDLHLRN